MILFRFISQGKLTQRHKPRVPRAPEMEMSPPNRRFLNYSEAAKLLHIPKGTLYAWVHENRVPHIRLSPRMVRFDEAELLAFIDKHRVPAGVQ